MKANGEKQFLYSIRRLPRRRAVAAFLLLFYVIAGASVIEYFSVNVSIDIPAHNKIAVLDSTQPPLVFGKKDSVQSSPNEFYFTGTHKSEPSAGEDGCFLCCAHAVPVRKVMNADAAAPPTVAAEKSSAIFSSRHRHSDSHSPPFYRPPRIV